ncbi:hypothetical protein [Aureimonas mangrovi]|uniref:hypothetical protein n=1 Tax=Aureimonas mangrovi TaxID=2758041 RepID=UPI00163D57EB|nr:hypothetical protein [Aureimonas mangrovi]
MSINRHSTLRIAAVATCGLSLAACMGPTYGTGTTSGAQLLNDVDGMFSFGSPSRERINYEERPELVRPDQIGQLPPPQTPRAVVEEEQQAAAAAAAVEPVEIGSRGNRAPLSSISRSAQDGSWIDPRELNEVGQRVTAAREAARQGNTNQRRYLTEPPVEYRQASASAPVGELGVDEEIKERRSRGTQPIGQRIRNALPF